MRPTRAALWPPAAALVLYGLAGQTGAGWLVLGATLCLALPVISLVLRPRLAGLQISAEPLCARRGEQAREHWVVRNTGRSATPAASLEERADGLLAPVTIGLPALSPGAQIRIDVGRTTQRRGVSTQRTFLLSSAAPWGLVRATRTVAVDADLVVGPRALAATAPRQYGAGSGGIPSGLPGQGTEVLGLRPWRVGDGAAAVSARASARHGRPVVLERERERGSRLIVVCTGPGEGPQWEDAVERSCAAAEQALHEGRVPLLLGAGVSSPARMDLRAVLRWHAALDTCSALDVTTATAVRRAAGATGMVVALGAPTPLLSGLQVMSL